MLSAVTCSIAAAQNVRTEAAAHPRIATAIRELEEAIRYMEAAPHDFGGHKAAAIRDLRAAIIELRAALAYRARTDRKEWGFIPVLRMGGFQTRRPHADDVAVLQLSGAMAMSFCNIRYLFAQGGRVTIVLTRSIAE